MKDYKKNYTCRSKAKTVKSCKIMFCAVIYFTFHCHNLPAQNYSISIGCGYYKNQNLKLNKPQDFFSASFDYKLTKLWSLSSGLVLGKIQYFDDTNSNYYEYNGLVNSHSYESHTYFMTKYAPISRSHFDLKVGIGVGLFTQRLKFPYEEASSSTGNAIITGEKSSTSIEFPVSVEPTFLISKRVGIGLRSGVFATSQHLIQSWHIGGQICVTL